MYLKFAAEMHWLECLLALDESEYTLFIVNQVSSLLKTISYLSHKLFDLAKMLFQSMYKHLLSSFYIWLM